MSNWRPFEPCKENVFMAEIRPLIGKDEVDRLPCGCWVGRKHSKSNCNKGLPSENDATFFARISQKNL